VIPAELQRLLSAQPPTSEASMVSGLGPGVARVNGRDMVNMACNDYLGLARDRRVLDAAHQALEEWGLGSAAGRVLSGNTRPHRALENQLAGWVGADDAALFSSCWTANAGVFELLARLAQGERRPLVVFSDRLNHASIIDAIRSQRRVISHLGTFDHHDAELSGLEHELETQPADSIKVIVTDGVFSMEGDQAPLAKLSGVALRTEALLILDDSHATGVAGPSGRGTAEAQEHLGRVDIITGTLGKALGGAIGGFVASSEKLTEQLRGTARSFVFSNNPPNVVIAGTHQAIEILKTDPHPLRTLRSRVRQLRDGVARIGLQSHAGDHPIVPVLLGADDRAYAARDRLRAAGVFATALTFPIVPRGEARLRLQVSAAHTPEAIDRVLNALPGA
jgi:glycine C-acetyltransferase